MNMKAEKITLEGLDISEKNILIHPPVDSYKEVIHQLGALLFENGYVKDSFIQAVLDREEIFPTGLEVSSGGGVAIPHADAEHVKESALGVAKLATPVGFGAMGEPDKTISVDIVLMLAIADPEKTVIVLRKVILILENIEALQALKNASSKGEVQMNIIEHIQSLDREIKEGASQH